LWCRNNVLAVIYPKSRIGAAKTYRAPSWSSWSWAAVDGIVAYTCVWANMNLKPTIKVIECITETATGDPFSTILSGTLVLSGPCKTATAVTSRQDETPQLIESSYNQKKDFLVGNLWLDDDEDATIQKTQQVETLYCLLMCQPSYRCGLLLLEAPGAEGHYIRIGLICSYSDDQIGWWEDAVETNVTII
jgi:hypothetical protein